MKYVKYRHAPKRWCSLLLVSSLLCTLPNMTPLPVYGATTLREAGSGEYFYTQLTAEEQAVYDAILNQIEELTKNATDPSGVKVTIPKDSTHSISGKPIFAVFRDHPEYFWVDASKLAWTESNPSTDSEGNTIYELSTFPTGTSFFYDGFTVDNLPQYRADLEAKIIEIKKNLPSTAIDDVSKLKYLNNWIAANNVYNAVGLGASNFSRCAASGLLSDNDKSTTDDDPVCYGYATAMKVLLDAFDIENAYIEGWAYNQGNMPSGEQHAWNYVKLDDGTGTKKWYALDPTWDDPSIQAPQARQVYFLVGSNTVTENALGEQYKTFGKNHDFTKSYMLEKLNFTYPALSTEARNPSADGNVVIRKPDDSTKGYDTLDAAMQAAQSGDTLILQNQVNVTSTITLKDGVTLDLNGQIGGNNSKPIAINSAVSPAFQIDSGRSVTIINSGSFTAISVSQEASESKVIQNDGTLTLGGNIKVSSETASMISGGQISGNSISLMPHTRQFASTSKKDITIFHVAKPKNPANGSYIAQQQDTVETLQNEVNQKPPTLNIQYYKEDGTLQALVQNCTWTLASSPNDGSNIRPQDALENGIYTFTTEVFDYPLTYQVEVSGLTSTPVEIDAITIEDIDAPVAGQALDTIANIPTTGVAVSSISWEPQNTGTAGYDTSYTVVVNLKPESGYTFASAVTVTINQEDADITKNQDGTITARYVFPATEKKTVQLQSIQQPDAIQATNGTQIQDLPLPTQISIVTDDSSINQANVQWTYIPVDGTSYDPSEKTEQTFRLEGTVILPEGVAANGVSLTVKIDVAVTAADVTAAPVASPQAGKYTSNQSVTLTSNTQDAMIYYTIDGSEPTVQDGIEYDAPILIEGREGEIVTTEIKAIAVAPDMQESAISTFQYTIEIPAEVGTVAAPVASPKAGTYTSNQSVVLSSDTSDATIYYTIDGSEPTIKNGIEYDMPIAIKGREGESVITEIKAIAVAPDLQDSSVSTFRYTIEIPKETDDTIEAPKASLQEGNYTSNQLVKLTSNTPDATIYYTLDGSEPTAKNGVEYDAPIKIEGKAGESVTVVLKAIAVAPDLQESTVSVFRYTIQIPGVVVGTTSAPVAQPAAGVYTKNQQLVLTSDTPGAAIYYTMDGSEPSVNNGVLYTIPIALQGKSGETVNITVKAIAVSTLLQDSEVVTYEYQLKLPASSGSGSSGGSTSGGSLKPGNTTKPNSGSANITTNSDDSKTETITGQDGTKTEITTNSDGSQQITTTQVDGTSATTILDTQGKQMVTVTLSQQSAESTVNQSTMPSIVLPIPDISANRSPQSPATVHVQVATDAITQVSIPVTNVVAGTIAVLVHPDGSKEILPTVVVKQNHMVVPVSQDTTIEIMDNSKTFHDVPENGWQKNAVDFMSSRALFVGTGVDTYSPNAPTQRAMLITALARLDGQTLTNSGGNWYDAGMIWAKENQISDGSHPLQNLNREQLATMLYRYAQQKGVAQSIENSLQNFTDQNDISAYAKEAMQWAVENHILYGDGSQLLPKNPATRAEVSAAIMRFCENVLA